MTIQTGTITGHRITADQIKGPSIWLYGIYMPVEGPGTEIAVYFENGSNIPEIPNYELVKVKLNEKQVGILENRVPTTGITRLGDLNAKNLSEYHEL